MKPSNTIFYPLESIWIAYWLHALYSLSYNGLRIHTYLIFIFMLTKKQLSSFILLPFQKIDYYAQNVFICYLIQHQCLSDLNKWTYLSQITDPVFHSWYFVQWWKGRNEYQKRSCLVLLSVRGFVVEGKPLLKKGIRSWIRIQVGI